MNFLSTHKLYSACYTYGCTWISIYFIYGLTNLNQARNEVNWVFSDPTPWTNSTVEKRLQCNNTIWDMKLFGLIQRAHNKRSPFFHIIKINKQSFWYCRYCIVCLTIVVNVIVQCRFRIALWNLCLVSFFMYVRTCNTYITLLK